jgi:hypothetical protein
MGFFKSEAEREAERDQEAYEQGQKDGSSSSALDQFAQNLFKDSDDPYQKGFDNGVENHK